MLAMTMTQFDQALIKMVGAFVTTLAMILVLRRFVLPYLLNVLGPARRRSMVAQAAE
jgi:hypothetical protein